MAYKRLPEPFRPTEAFHYEVDVSYCREAVSITAPAGEDIVPGTACADEAGTFIGINIEPVFAGETTEVAALVRGPAIVKASRVFFPTVLDEADAVDAAATADLEVSLRADMAAAGILIR